MQQLTRNFHTEQYFDFTTSQMFTPATSEQAADSVFPPLSVSLSPEDVAKLSVAPTLAAEVNMWRNYGSAAWSNAAFT